MTHRKGGARGDAAGTPRVSARRKRNEANDVVPDVVREMLVEVGASTSSKRPASELPERPSKRKRPGARNLEKSAQAKPEEKRGVSTAEQDEDEDEDDDDVEFEDVPLPEPTVQTMLRDSEDEDDDDEAVQFEDAIDYGSLQPTSGPADEVPKGLNLNLTAQKAAMTPARRSVDRRKPATREEKERRVHVHKVHLLCLLSHVSVRNRWCNDQHVQSALRPLLTDKMVKYLNPGTHLTQFGRTESLKNGVQEAASMFKMRYSVTERGLRRALWAEEESQLQNYELPEDIDSTLDKADFLQAAKTLKGSRDVGAQLFCALLRSAGVKTRLVCSLQPLACTPGAPTMAKQRNTQTPGKMSQAEVYAAAMARYETHQPEATSTPSPRRRLGHPNAAGYNVPSISSPSTSVPRPPDTPKRIRNESPFPIYWLEVLDIAHQKWQPVGPLVTSTQWKPKALEPPASDRGNSMSYVLAFEPDGSAKDVTRRYARAYNSKTRKTRIDGFATEAGRSAGERWWRRTTKVYRKPWPDDVDQIEDTELAAAEAREPMPRNVADFRDHPVYALERHLRRHEVLVPGAQPAGTVGAGSKGLLERIYRRRDVRVARSREKWYRMGREVRSGEEAVKVLPKRVSRKRGRWDDEDEEGDDDDDPDKVGLFGDQSAAAGTPIYTLEQTELYVPPPVRNGRVPKNKFGNVDVYVPSMVPEGGAYVVHDRAAQAAFILGVDYAPALTGFQFRGRQGTAVLKGVVVPAEAEEGVKAVVEGLEDLDVEAERERRARVALRMWSRFLKALRIRERIWANVDSDEEEREAKEREDKGKGVADDEEDMELDGAPSDVTEELDFIEDDGGGGGFLLE